MSHLQEPEHLRIPLNDIKSATNNFAKQNFLGQGGFGRVYKGELPSSSSVSSDQPEITVAVKRLDIKGGQGEHKFLMEIVMLASYKHDNLVSLVGFCDEDNEKVLVYKYEFNGSLDRHLASTNLTWEQRLRICLGAAKGLEYLHGGVGAGHRVLHRDVKSSNILLGPNWESKISDFGLSKIGPTNQQFTFLVTNACGTFGYLDPCYGRTGVLTKESDVYSFGVVLFEVLCGRLAVMTKYDDQRRFLFSLVKFHSGTGTLHDIIMPNLLEQMEPNSLQVFSDIAFLCLNEERKQRPAMGLIVKELETALHHQLGDRGLRTILWGLGADTGGGQFLFLLESNQKLKNITIYYHQWIHGLMFTTEDSSGLLHTSKKYGAYNHYGDHDKIVKFVMDFDAGEELIGISGTVGKRMWYTLITSLSFVTNKNEYGPFGEAWEADTQYSRSWDLGLFVGFCGRAGWYLDCFGCCCRRLSSDEKFCNHVNVLCDNQK